MNLNVEKKRVSNFTFAEKQFLLNLVSSKYSHILEDKKTNRVSLDEKNRTWKKIEKEFNANAPITCFRSNESLKRFYENKKKELRRKMADEKKSHFLTGGGPAPPAPNLDETDNILLSIVNEKTVKGFDVTCDSDYEPITKKPHQEEEETELTFTIDNEYQILEEEAQTPEVNVKLAVLDNSCIKSWGKYKTTDLQTPRHPALQGTPNVSLQKNKSRRRPTNSVRVLTASDVSEKYNVLLDKRLVLIETQVQQATEYQTFQREEHKLKLNNLRKQEELQNLEKEEKLLKMKLLHLEIKHKNELLLLNI